MRFPHRPHVPRPHLPRTHHYRPPHVHRSPPHRPFRGHGPSGGGPSGPLGWIVAIIILGIGAAIFFGTFRKGNNGFGGGFGKKDADLSPPQAVAAQPWSATEGGLTLTVDRVEGQGGGRFRIWMTATNNGSDKLTLPLFGYFKAVDNLGNEYKADPFSSTFPRDLSPGQTLSGYANMETPLNANASVMKVAFTTVFGSFAVDSIMVDGIPVPNE